MRWMWMLCWSVITPSLSAQESVPELRQASDAGRRVMEQRVMLPIPGPAMVYDTATVYKRVERMPEFPKGEKGLQRYLARETRVPQEFIDARMTGSVRIAFVVDEGGAILESRIKRGLGHGCDEEAIRVVSAMPRWKPGTQGGKAVKVWVEVDVRFAPTP